MSSASTHGRGALWESLTFSSPTLDMQVRNKIVHILNDALGTAEPGVHVVSEPDPTEAWSRIERAVLRDRGLLTLGRAHPTNPQAAVIGYFLEAASHDALALIGLAFAEGVAHFERFNNQPPLLPFLPRRSVVSPMSPAIEELNRCLRLHHVPFSFIGRALVADDNSLLEQQLTRPAFILLSEQRFAGAEAEFLSAHEHWRARRNKEALVDALKAFESVIKVVLHARGVTGISTLSASKLVQALFIHGVVPSFMQGSFENLRPLLESVAVPRNRRGAHGQGDEIVVVPDSLAKYALLSTAASIVFVADADRESNAAAAPR